MTARRVAWRASEDGGAARLDVALAAQADWLSRSAAQIAIRNGLVRVNGNVESRPAAVLKPEDEVEAFLPELEPEGIVAADVPLNVVYEDEHLLVLDKPTGVAVHPGPGHRNDTLVNGLLARYPQIAEVGPPDRPGVVHRLDLDTTGLLIFALTPEAYAELGTAMRARQIKRTYIALVHGNIQPPLGTVDAPIGRDPANRTRQAVVESGRAARTHYRLVESVRGGSLLEVELETGRMHQIRVHMAAIGFPVMGDPTYKTGATSGANYAVSGLNRQFLHACRLRFTHPMTGREIVVESPLPPDLQLVLDELRREQ